MLYGSVRIDGKRTVSYRFGNRRGAAGQRPKSH